MKKKIFTIVVAIALISVFSLCLVACNKKDEGKLTEDTDFEKLVSAEVTEEGWNEAFKIPENVTIKQSMVSNYVSKDENGEEKTETSTNEVLILLAKDQYGYKYTSEKYSSENYLVRNSDGSILAVEYGSYYDEEEEKEVVEGPYGKTIASDDEDISDYEEYFDASIADNEMFEAFKTQFSQFSYNAEKGAYVAESITYTYTYGENDQYSDTETFNDVVIKIVDGQVVYIAYTQKNEYSESSRTSEIAITLYNFGTTTVTVPEYTEYSAGEN